MIARGFFIARRDGHVATSSRTPTLRTCGRGVDVDAVTFIGASILRRDKAAYRVVTSLRLSRSGSLTSVCDVRAGGWRRRKRSLAERQE